jgi:ferrochelatase
MALKNNEGVLLINLGSPKELSKKSVREYLRVFLSDDNVIDLPKIIQQMILRLFILPFRPKKTLEAYEQIWTSEGFSPNYYQLKVLLKNYQKKLVGMSNMQ